MKNETIYRWILILVILILLPTFQVSADGGYFSRSQELVAVSADQRAIIIKNGNEISMTFSTGYTGEGEDFGWDIPTPVPPAIEDVWEAGEKGEKAFEILDKHTAPVITTIRKHGCFPSGTKVLTVGGPRSIEMVAAGTEVYACDMATGEWIFTKVLKRLSHQYDGDMITIRIGWVMIQATGNHPFYVVKGDRLASRPVPQDVPKEEQGTTEYGRWVEARDLRVGDVLKDRGGEGLMITALSSRQEKTEVFNLEVEGYHNYAVHQKGILVHNKAGKAEEESESTPLVTVYGKVILEHYEVSILGAADASALLGWLQENGFQVNPEAEEVLDTYIDKNWAFVAVKLNPGERRHYENEFLPPLTIGYQHNALIFPLHISSVSTTETIKITLYVIAESTVSSSNFTTTILNFEDELSVMVNIEEYIESCIVKTLASVGGRGLAVMWSGMLDFHELEEDKVIVDELMIKPFQKSKEVYLTRLESRIEPSAMTEDIKFILDPSSKVFEVNILAKEGYGSSLIVAARYGETDTVRKLLEAGANMHVQDNEGKTALNRAVEEDHSEVVRILLQAGAEVNSTDKDDMTSLMWAAVFGHTEVVGILLEAGADVNASDDYGRTSLTIATSRNHTEIVKYLLQVGADANAKDYGGWSSLMFAALGNHTEIVKYLLQAGADVNAKNNGSWTALMYATRGNHTEIVKYLLQAGADVNTKNQYGWTALDYALEEGNKEITKLIMEARYK